jgi:hypothetical protein
MLCQLSILEEAFLYENVILELFYYIFISIKDVSYCPLNTNIKKLYTFGKNGKFSIIGVLILVAIVTKCSAELS